MIAHTYILVIWTIVGASGWSPLRTEYDWRPIGEFHLEQGRSGGDFRTALQMCEEGARQLNLKPERYRCIKAK